MCTTNLTSKVQSSRPHPGLKTQRQLKDPLEHQETGVNLITPTSSIENDVGSLENVQRDVHPERSLFRQSDRRHYPSDTRGTPAPGTDKTNSDIRS